MNVKDKDDTKLVMLVFAVISLLLVLAMINNFKVIDGLYFCGVLLFAIRFLLLSRQ